MTEVALLTALAVLFVIAGPLLVIAKAARLSVIPALILTGLLVGQLNLIDETVMLELARLGIAFLVFTFSVQTYFQAKCESGDSICEILLRGTGCRRT